MSATILIVEDHDAVRRGLRDWLAGEFPGWRPIEAASGEEAVVLSVIESPHLVLMDITMSGIETTRRIKAALPATQVVILTVHEDDHHRADATAAGANAYVAKRVMRTELIPTLAALLDNDRS